MNLTNDQKFKMLLGEYAVQIITLETQLVEVAAKLAETEAENAKLKAEIADVAVKHDTKGFEFSEGTLDKPIPKTWELPQDQTSVPCAEGVANGRDTRP